jgi:hypothetical protein
MQKISGEKRSKANTEKERRRLEGELKIAQVSILRNSTFGQKSLRQSCILENWIKFFPQFLDKKTTFI